MAFQNFKTRIYEIFDDAWDIFWYNLTRRVPWILLGGVIVWAFLTLKIFWM